MKIAQRIYSEPVNDLNIIYIARISLYTKQWQGVMPKHVEDAHVLMLYIHTGIRLYSCGLALFCASSCCFINKFMLYCIQY